MGNICDVEDFRTNVLKDKIWVVYQDVFNSKVDDFSFLP